MAPAELGMIHNQISLAKNLKELVGSVEFCRLLRPWEERERESARAREGEET